MPEMVFTSDPQIVPPAMRDADVCFALFEQHMELTPPNTEWASNAATISCYRPATHVD